ncbi:MAG: hypothetical protein MUD08_17150 [Cytophagales bacterium]|nr:hypothetical protein [Cytophagales bacterium]
MNNPGKQQEPTQAEREQYLKQDSRPDSPKNAQIENPALGGNAAENQDHTESGDNQDNE